MGQVPSSIWLGHEREFLGAVRAGDREKVESFLSKDGRALYWTTLYDRLTPLHIAAANGQVEVLSMILDQSVPPDLLNRHKQTSLMLAAMRGTIACVQKLLQAGANILMFDSRSGRTCLHYAAYHGHVDCLQAILSAARSTVVSDSWGFSRFVNTRDGRGATPLHLAARRRRPECLHILLESGALVCASTGGNGYSGSTPLHFAARGGCVDCVQELLAWGADRQQTDSSGRTPYDVAVKRKYEACAALLDPSVEPLVWPSPLKFIAELNPDAKALLEGALRDANREREKNILKVSGYLPQSPVHSDGEIDDGVSEDSDSGLCCICFDQICTIEVQGCRHQMCAHCTLALCCHNKPDPESFCSSAPVCPFCRSDIAQLVVVKTKDNEEGDEDSSSRLRISRKTCNSGEGSSSFKGLPPAMSPSGKMGGLGTRKIADSCDVLDKP